MILELCLYLIKTASFKIRKGQCVILLYFEQKRSCTHLKSAHCDLTEGTDTAKEIMCLPIAMYNFLTLFDEWKMLL